MRDNYINIPMHLILICMCVLNIQRHRENLRKTANDSTRCDNKRVCTKSAAGDLSSDDEDSSSDILTIPDLAPLSPQMAVVTQPDDHAPETTTTQPNAAVIRQPLPPVSLQEFVRRGPSWSPYSKLVTRTRVIVRNCARQSISSCRDISTLQTRWQS